MYRITVLVSIAILAAGHTPSPGFVLSPSGIEYVPSDSCGGEFQGTEGTFMSPNYPGNYPPNADCTWIITVPTYAVIRISFESFHLYSGNTYDYLQIRDGNSSSDTQLAKCYYSACSDVTSTGNTLFIYFHSDGYSEATGFKLNWIAVLGSCFYCDSSPDSNIYDPTCGRDGYHGRTTSCQTNCYTNVHYDGSHRVERGCIDSMEADGSCYDTGISTSCFCTTGGCNNHLCQNCTSPTSPAATTITEPSITTVQSSYTSSDPSEITTNIITTNQPSTNTGTLQCYSCIDCRSINGETDVVTSEEFLTCFTAIALGNNNFVVRGGSPDFYEDGICRHEADGVIFCYCTSNRCNNDAATNFQTK